MPYPVPPLGLCLLADHLNKRYEVVIYDGVFDNGKQLLEKIQSYNPDYVGLSIRNIDDMDLFNPTSYIDLIEEHFIKILKKSTNSPLILGGSGFSIFPQYLLHRFEADYGVFGEAEEVLPRLLDSLDRGSEPSEISGVITKDCARLDRPKNYYVLTDSSFSEIDRKIDFTPYRLRGAYSIQTKRGCAHKCIYCTYNYIEGSRFRTRKPESIAREIREAQSRLGEQVTFEFVDSTFNDPPGHAEAICREIIKLKLNVRLRTMGINPKNVSRELFDLMLEAGFAQIDSTPDTASPVMLKNFQKNFTLKELTRTAQIIREYDMPTMWFFIFGGPGETKNTINETFSFIDEWVNTYDMVHMTMGLRVYPNTPLYDLAVAEGRLDRKDSLISPYFYISQYFNKEELYALIKQASLQRPNCIPVTESTPPPEMLEEAMKLRNEKKLQEPMFRTLLKIRYRMFKEKGIINMTS